MGWRRTIPCITSGWAGRTARKRRKPRGFRHCRSRRRRNRNLRRPSGWTKEILALPRRLIEFDCAAPGIAGGGEDKAQPQIEQLAAMDASEGHYAAGNCRRQKKDYAAAEAEFDKALVDAKAPDLIFDIGDYAVKRKEPDRVMAVVSAGQRAASSRCAHQILPCGSADPEKRTASRSRETAARIPENRADANGLSASGGGA